ncbi:MAG: hypothetical protein IK104_07060 [Clostridia bacterium]|nr:hypothetical protein [Clostridia bacterium]
MTKSEADYGRDTAVTPLPQTSILTYKRTARTSSWNPLKKKFLEISLENRLETAFFHDKRAAQTARKQDAKKAPNR